MNSLSSMFSINNHLRHEIMEILEIAEAYAKHKSHAFITINHIIYGCMTFIKNTLKNPEDATFFKETYPILNCCYIEPASFLRKSNNFISCKKNSKTPYIDKDIIVFANGLKDFSKSRCLNFIFDLEKFYLFLIHMNATQSFKQFYYIPHGTLSTLDFKKSFDVILENFFNEDAYYIEDQKNFADGSSSSTTPCKNSEGIYNKRLNIYSSPIKINYTTDLTYSAYKGRIPVVIGREKEINRLVDILCKKNKNNPVLIGEPGVGKTALVHALANRIVTNQISPKLQNHYILEFDVSGSIAGAKYRGDYEERIKSTIDNIISLTKSGKKIIVYIDEIHTIVGAGSAEGSIDLSSILKPFLLNSSIKVIGTSTFKDYREVESDKALERRFDTIKVNEPSFQETIEILTGLQASLEEFHSVSIPSNTIEAVITLSKRYITDRFLPDKAIDLLDETCSIKANSSLSTPNSNVTVLPEDVFIAISKKKEIPIQRVKNTYDLMSLEDNLNSKVIGQNHVSSSLATAVRRTKAGLNDENRPLASFMFIGPTGVGKTETAKALADLVFSGKDKIIRFDMSEYMEEHSISKLIGSPPGYVGYEEAGLLTEQVRRNPYSLILFDEFEKAHPKVCNILLQILDEGSLTDSKGEHINFKNTIIILTSNVGVSELSKKSVGFGEQTSSKSKNILAEVKKKFSPEFLNRLDEIIQFNQLSEEDIFKITKLHISSLIKKVNNLNIKIDISDEVISEIAKLGYKPEYGARELRRTIDREIKNPLADLILQNNVDYISVKLVNKKIKISHQHAVLPV